MEHHFTPDQARNIYSHTKSYMSTAVGLAIADGKLSLDDRLAEFFPEAVPENAQPELFEIRLPERENFRKLAISRLTKKT